MVQDNPTIIDGEEESSSSPPLVSQEVAPQTERVEQYVPILSGETLEDVAAKYQTDVQTIIDRNQLNPDWYFANQWVFVSAP